MLTHIRLHMQNPPVLHTITIAASKAKQTEADQQKKEIH